MTFANKTLGQVTLVSVSDTTTRVAEANSLWKKTDQYFIRHRERNQSFLWTAGHGPLKLRMKWRSANRLNSSFSWAWRTYCLLPAWSHYWVILSARYVSERKFCWLSVLHSNKAHACKEVDAKSCKANTASFPSASSAKLSHHTQPVRGRRLPPVEMKSHFVVDSFLGPLSAKSIGVC